MVAEGRRLRVPRDHVEAFKEFAALSDTSASAILDLLGRDPPVLGYGEIERLVAKAAPEAEEIAEDLVEALTALVILRTTHEWGVDEVAEGIAASENLDLDEHERSQLGDRLRAALDATTLLVNAKAADLSAAHERLFHIARIVTEVRPVFGRDASAPPAAAVISHFLELAYFAPGNRDVEAIFVGLNDSSLSTLAAQAKRAEEKAASLRKFLNAQGLYVYAPDDENR